MPSPNSGETSTDTSAKLEEGGRYEQAGAADRALAAYRAALATAVTPADHAHAHLRLARIHRNRAAWDTAIAESREAQRHAGEAGDEDLLAEAMNAEVGVHVMRGSFDEGHAVAERALPYAHSPRTRGVLLQNRGSMAARAGDFEAAHRFFADSVAAFRDAGYERGLGTALCNAAAAACDVGDHQRALALAQEAVEVALRAQAYDLAVLALNNQGEALVGLDRLDEAESMLGGALGHFASAGDPLRQAECLEILGGLHARRDDFQEAAERCFRHALALARTAGDRVTEQRIAGRLRAIGVEG